MLNPQQITMSNIKRTRRCCMLFEKRQYRYCQAERLQWRSDTRRSEAIHFETKIDKFVKVLHAYKKKCKYTSLMARTTFDAISDARCCKMSDCSGDVNTCLCCMAESVAALFTVDCRSSLLSVTIVRTNVSLASALMVILRGWFWLLHTLLLGCLYWTT